MGELDKLLGGSFEEFDNFNRTGFILGYENWDRYDFKALLKLVVLLVWDMRKNKLYGDQDGTAPGCSCSCPLTGDLTSSTCVCGCVVNGVKRYGQQHEYYHSISLVMDYLKLTPLFPGTAGTTTAPASQSTSCRTWP